MPEQSPVPGYLDGGDLHDTIRRAGGAVVTTTTIALDPGEERAYGTWHRMGLACRHLADAVADAARADLLPVGLLGNCTSLLGMLAGLQRVDPARRIGLLFLDAHADFNTPETTLSGMLGGMPVAIAAGLCLANLRTTAGLAPPLPTNRILIAGARDVDSAEQRLLDEHAVELVATSDVGPALAALAERVDVIYAHLDMDVIDAAEVPGHHTAVPGGPSSAEVAETIRVVFACDRVAALGIASTPPPERDRDGRARAAAHRLIAAAVGGAVSRS
ncbi:MAG: arginase [Planctomycetes bacterium]|nr:arginase [Planctomycetota bacterium]